MANINETISEVEKLNPELARQLKKYVKDHSYGLVFEHNLPEAVRLYTKTPTVGDTVNIMPERGKKEKAENSVPWIVKYIDGDDAVIEHDGETKAVSVNDIVTLVSYRDVIYPGLREIDRVERGNPDDPYHMVINSENYHALEAFAYCYPGKVDCIYIDPPYNTGAKDWKYNNDYVDGNDQYRHSKWLAFMERRLKLAKQLLNPKDSVLIVTIDEKEYLRLGLLLEQVFPHAAIEMVTSVISAKGVARSGQFSRVEEYIFFVRIGEATIGLGNDNMLDSSRDAKSTVGEKVEWLGMRRREPSAVRGASKNQFYPVFVEEDTGKVVGIGDSITDDVDRLSIVAPTGCAAIWPLRSNGAEGIWGITPKTARRDLERGYIKASVTTRKGERNFTVKYLPEGIVKGIENGSVTVVARDNDGSVIAEYNKPRGVIPKRVWNKQSHNAETSGSLVLRSLVPKSNFPYPKSLYAVEDALRFILQGKPNALVLDFFAGSGTTLHAVNLLNAEDGGHRRCICVTNNEVSADEAKKFAADGFRQGDPEWEERGIARYVTWPRTKCSIEGIDVNGNPLKGNYLGSDIPMADGFKANAIFCELTYESAWPIRPDRAFDAIAPILWMQAGCRGPIIRRIGKSYLTTDYYGVLFDYNQASKFCEKVKGTPSIKTVYVVTDDQRRYSNMCKRLPNIEVHRLYETYLKTFEICGEGGLD